MNPNAPLEECLEAVGSELRERPRLTDRVMAEVRKAAADGSTQRRSTAAPRARYGRRWPFFAAFVTTIAVAMLMLLTLPPSPSVGWANVGWADVAETVRSQKWIRATVTSAHGRYGTFWLSPERQVWARTSGDSHYTFADGRERAKYECRGRGPIIRMPLGEEDARRILPLDDLSRDKDRIGPWMFGREQIAYQKRREVTEAGKTWIEFQMVLVPGGDNRTILRVDPETRLPVYMLITSAKDATDTTKWQFDYPAEGPTDIYALGVPRDVEIDDRMPSKEALRVLDGIAATRAKIGDFRLLVDEREGRYVYVVWRKGDRWRVDHCLRRRDGPRRPHKPADGQSLEDWFAEYLERSRQVPLYVYDGKTVYKNRNLLERDGKKPQWEPTTRHAPQALLSGQSWSLGFKIVPLFYPDLTPGYGDTFEFDPQPANAPGCVLIKLSVPLSDRKTIGHGWRYIDPAKGYAVVRTESFGLPADTPPNPEVNSDGGFRMEDFQRSPHGFWYPTVVHEMSSLRPSPDQTDQPAVREIEATGRYHFDFDADLPDSLFTIDEADVLKE